MSKFSPLLTIMDAAARKAGRSLTRDFNEVEHLQISKKGPADFVSAADRRADQILRTELQKARPTFGFHTEEGKDEAGDGVHRWIIDPLDGTTNFLHAVPHFCISIALEKEGEIVAAYIYHPLYDESYWAEKGSGAFSGRSGRLRVSMRKDFSTCLMATGIPFQGFGDMDEFSRELAIIAPKVCGVRRMGAAALDLAYVAAGRFDGYWERDLKAWDIAAGILLVREAGGYVLDYSGAAATSATTNIIASNAEIVKSFAELLGVQSIPALQAGVAKKSVG